MQIQISPFLFCLSVHFLTIAFSTQLIYLMVWWKLYSLCSFSVPLCIFILDIFLCFLTLSVPFLFPTNFYNHKLNLLAKLLIQLKFLELLSEYKYLRSFSVYLCIFCKLHFQPDSFILFSGAKYILSVPFMFICPFLTELPVLQLQTN